MVCNKCGKAIAADDTFCGTCGTKIHPTGSVNFPSIETIEAEITKANSKTAIKKKNAFATISLWFGLASIILWEFSIIPIVAIILGIIGIVNGVNKKLPTWQAIAGLVLGIVFLIVRDSQL